MKEIPIYLGVTPAELGDTKPFSGQEIQLLYRCDSRLKLLQASGKKSATKGHIMGIDNQITAPQGDSEAFCQQVLGQVKTHCYAGVCCLFHGPTTDRLAQVTQALAKLCHQQRLQFLVSEPYGHHAPHSKVLISTALSGGTLEARFAQAKQQYGAQRVLMDIDCVREDFLLPAPHGSGETLSEQQLTNLMVQENAAVFFSKELSARYFTYQNTEHSLRFVLFDDQVTTKEKMKLAKQWNLAGAVLTFSQVRWWNLL